jgi:hypothetical protein
LFAAFRFSAHSPKDHLAKKAFLQAKPGARYNGACRFGFSNCIKKDLHHGKTVWFWIAYVGNGCRYGATTS